jgi:ribosomal protein S18 acetylase RimI-like enzyme
MSMPEQVLIGAVQAGRVVGFCQLALSPLSMLSLLGASPSLLVPVLRLAIGDLRTLIRGVALSVRPPVRLKGTAEVAFIAVDPRSQRRGIGSCLVGRINDLAAERGHTSLVTRTSNESARRMYERHFEAHVIGTRVLAGRTYWYLQWPTSASTGGSPQ